MRKGGRVVCGGIHMSDIPSFPYRLLWEERSVVSVANLTRADGEEFLTLAPRVPVRTTTTPYPLDKTNEALDDLRGWTAGRRRSARAVRREQGLTPLRSEGRRSSDGGAISSPSRGAGDGRWPRP